MKKILLIVCLAITATISAKDFCEKKNSEEKRETKEEKKIIAERCHTYGMVAWCKPNDMVIDSVCWDDAVPGSYEQSRACMRENGQLYNIFMCGTSDYAGLTDSIY